MNELLYIEGLELCLIHSKPHASVSHFTFFLLIDLLLLFVHFLLFVKEQKCTQISFGESRTCKKTLHKLKKKVDQDSRENLEK
jgi:hypothetical protein